MSYLILTLITIAALLLHFRFFQPETLTHNKITRSSFFDTFKNNSCNYPNQNTFIKFFKPSAIDLILEFCFYRNEYSFFYFMLKNLINSKLNVNLNDVWNIYEHIKIPYTYIRQKYTDQFIVVTHLPDKTTVQSFQNMFSGPRLDFKKNKRYMLKREECILSSTSTYDNRNKPTNVKNIKSGMPRNNCAGLNKLASIKDQTKDISKKSSSTGKNYRHK